MSVSLKTIAQELGVSVSTVSRVVNGKDRVDGNTRKRVEAALKAHDYQPNQMARTLRGKSSRTFGVLVSDISNLLFSRLIKGVEQAAMDRGYDVIVVNTDGDPGRVKRGVSLLLAKQVSGIIMASGGFDQQVEKKCGNRESRWYLSIPHRCGREISVPYRLIMFWPPRS